MQIQPNHLSARADSGKFPVYLIRHTVMLSARSVVISLLAIASVAAQPIVFADNFEQPAVEGPPGQILFNNIDSSMVGNCVSRNSFGVQFGDLNFDGWPDMFTVSHSHPSGEHCIWLNQNGSRFVHNAQASASLDDVGNTTCTWSAQVTDFTGDGKPDIWCRGTEAGSDFYENTTATMGGTPSFEHTGGWAGEPSGPNAGGYKDDFLFADFNGNGLLQRVNLSGIIRDVDNGSMTNTTGVTKPDIFDVDGDTYPDLWSVDSGKMLRNLGNGEFVERNFDPDLNQCYFHRGMFHVDYDKDGDLDIFCLVYNDSPSSDVVILRNDGGFNFTSIDAGFVSLYSADYRRVALTKGTFLLDDFDNDSLLDLLTVNVGKRLRLHQQTSQGTFESVSDFIDLTGKFNWMMASTDYDNDGLIDPVINLAESGKSSAMIFNNKTNTDNRYINVLLRGDDMGLGKNVNGQGALIVAYVPGTNVVINSHYVESSWRRTGPNFSYHLGLGSADAVDLKVIWPSGFEASQTFHNTASNKTYRVEYRASTNDVISTWLPGSGW